MTKNEIMLGDLRGGLCSSGLCRQLRAVAAAELESLTADNALAIESLAKQQAEIGRLREAREGCCAELGATGAELIEARAERDRLRAALKEASELLDPARNMTDRVWRERRDKLLAQQDEPECTCLQISQPSASCALHGHESRE